MSKKKSRRKTVQVRHFFWNDSRKWYQDSEGTFWVDPKHMDDFFDYCDKNWLSVNLVDDFYYSFSVLLRMVEDIQSLIDELSKIENELPEE